MQHVGLAHQRRELAEQPLLRLGDLLHVVAFAARRLVAIDVVDADAVRGGRQRSGHGLQRARPDRGDDGGRLAIGPGQRGGGMGHLHLVAAIDRPRHALFVIDAQHLAEIRRAVAEDGEIFPHTLLQKPEDERFGQRHLDDRSQGSLRPAPPRARRPWQSAARVAASRRWDRFPPASDQALGFSLMTSWRMSDFAAERDLKVLQSCDSTTSSESANRIIAPGDL